jgi:uncharacterized protein YukE
MTALRDAEPITFDFQAAADLAARFRASAECLRSQVGQRDRLADHARHDWRGVYAGKFDTRMQVCAGDANRLAAALDEAARQVDELARLAREEQARRAAAREWKVRHDAWQRKKDDENFLERGWDGLFGDDEPKPPDLVPTQPPRLPIAPAAPRPR